jgi:hypothetical protein
VRYARTVLNGLGAQRKWDAAKMPPDGQTVRPFVINEKLHDVCSAAAGPMPRRLIVSLVAIAIRLRLIFSDNETERPYLFSMAIARMTIRCLSLVFAK